MNWLALGAICLLGAADEGTWRLSPRYAVGQEVVYVGSVAETHAGDHGATFEQRYEIETSMLVMEMDSKNSAKVGCFTVMKLPDRRPAAEKAKYDDVTSAHFDILNVSSDGRPTWESNGAQVQPAPEGYSSWELGYFAEVPGDPVKLDQTWLIRRPGQPQILAKAEGTDRIAGFPCVRVKYEQESQNWTAAQIHFVAWKAVTTAWIDPRTGLVMKLAREHSMRHPGDDDIRHTVKTTYEQASNLRYSGDMLQQRSADFVAGHDAQQDLTKAIAQVADQGTKPVAAVGEQLKVFLSNKLYTTPYRPALQRIIEASEQAKAHSNIVNVSATMAGESSHAQIGRPARNFVVRVANSTDTITPKKVAGKAVLLVFLDPASRLSLQALQTAVYVADPKRGPSAEIYAVCTNMTEQDLATLKEVVPGEYTVCTGKALDKAYGADGVPHAIFIDAQGILRGNFMGYGPEMATLLKDALHRYGQKPESTSSSPSRTSTFVR